MSRPQKQGLDYFPHDTDARGDIKIKALMALYGAKGYCFYFSMLEEVFRAENGRITAGSGPLKAGLAKDMCINVKEFDEILATALEIGCFDKEAFDAEGVITSNGIKKRLLRVTMEREKERTRKEKSVNNYIKKDFKREREKENQTRKTPGKPPENSKLSIVKNKYLDFVYLSGEEYEKLVKQFGERGTQDRIFNLNQYGHQKNKKFKEYDSHYHTILVWERKNKAQGDVLERSGVDRRGVVQGPPGEEWLEDIEAAATGQGEKHG